MKKTYKKLAKTQKEIKQMREIISHVKQSDYFVIFSNEKRRQEEVFIHENDLKKLLKEEFRLFEKLKTKIELLKCKNSFKSRELTIKTNNYELSN